MMGRIRRNISHILRYFHELGMIDLILSSILYIKADYELKQYLARHPKHSTAVILHLYHVDMWDSVRARLGSEGFDESQLFVSIPYNKRGIKSQIQSDFENSCVIVVPNRGRDILPFMKIAKCLSCEGYGMILKIHSKKSPQRTKGTEWTEQLFGSLLTRTILSRVNNKNNPQNLFMVGPKDNYIPLNIYYQDNRAKVTKILEKVYSSKIANHVNENLTDYGFFAGTMFWVDISKLSKLIRYGAQVRNYQKEAAQLDGTFAHAMERAVSLVGQIDEYTLYETDGNQLDPVRNDSERSQEWWDSKASNRKDIGKKNLRNVLKSI